MKSCGVESRNGRCRRTPTIREMSWEKKTDDTKRRRKIKKRRIIILAIVITKKVRSAYETDTTLARIKRINYVTYFFPEYKNITYEPAVV